MEILLTPSEDKSSPICSEESMIWSYLFCPVSFTRQHTAISHFNTRSPSAPICLEESMVWSTCFVPSVLLISTLPSAILTPDFSVRNATIYHKPITWNHATNLFLLRQPLYAYKTKPVVNLPSLITTLLYDRESSYDI
ncbi:hypothetical protein AVEN_140682-1 [Araneus ventricosus]|uniref:Uncharacterized protein n=1 Tax=Araneus ventricosus TaxID=182803 RepID=A0A4Y2C420_ARAVE|nr:hypothetical protein AVEN_140682-1 [Araneus ventricosus]